MAKKNVNSALSGQNVYHGHRHRMKYGSDCPIVVDLVPVCHYSETQSVAEYDNSVGRFTRVKKTLLHNPVSDLSCYRVSDFYLENQIESGSINNLSRVVMINNDTSASEAHVLESLSRLDSLNESNNN